MLYLISKRNEAESILLSTIPPHKGDYISFKASHDASHCEGTFGLANDKRMIGFIKIG
ncbi:MAG: hypothetical protein GXP32_01135, partial [Kiritimatiellaeota bacterium]|nr:hypothetical protein [Kiritimatiellota bacterium]